MAVSLAQQSVQTAAAGPGPEGGHTGSMSILAGGIWPSYHNLFRSLRFMSFYKRTYKFLHLPNQPKGRTNLVQHEIHVWTETPIKQVVRRPQSLKRSCKAGNAENAQIRDYRTFKCNGLCPWF